MKIEMLINKYNMLDESYVPSDLYQTDNNDNNFHNYKDASLKPMVSASIMPYFLAMQSYALKSGYNIIIDSGYRSYDYQQKVWDSIVAEKGIEEAKKSVALPGTSEHQTGLAIDVAFIRDGVYTDDVKENDPEVLWLQDNAYKFGFILRYPKYSEQITGYKFEPWHYRFVGVKLATVLRMGNLTLEEYYQNKKRIDFAFNIDFIETPLFVTYFQFVAAYLYVFANDFSLLWFDNIISFFHEQYPEVKIIKSTYQDLEKMVVGLSKMNSKELEIIAGEELINFIKQNFYRGR